MLSATVFIEDFPNTAIQWHLAPLLHPVVTIKRVQLQLVAQVE